MADEKDSSDESEVTRWETDFLLSLSDIESSVGSQKRASIRLLRELMPVYMRWFERERRTGTTPMEITVGHLIASAIMLTNTLKNTCREDGDWEALSRGVANSLGDMILSQGDEDEEET